MAQAMASAVLIALPRRPGRGEGVLAEGRLDGGQLGLHKSSLCFIPRQAEGSAECLGRAEQVRASMLQTDEVQLATILTPEQAKQMPASLIELTGEAVGIRFNTEHPVLQDLRVRQALNLALDRQSMIDALYGPVAEPLNGMMVRKSSVGWNPNLKEHPSDPAKAKQLIQEAARSARASS
jgi:ABC-type transport system substrate-binding protein